MKKIKKAYDIAVEKLRSCYTNEGIVAGLYHYNEYWSRDSFFASFGACKLKDFDIVKKVFFYL